MRRRHLSLYVPVAVALIALAAVLVALLTGPSGKPSGYGVAATGANEGVGEQVAVCSELRSPCPAGKLRLMPPFGGPTEGAAAFAAFRAQVLKRGGYMRLWVPYDALSAGRPGGGCRRSKFALSRSTRFGQLRGREVFNLLVWNIQGARALGLTPEVVFNAGSGVGAQVFPQPGYGDASRPFAGLTPAGLDYYCGLLGIMRQLRAELGRAAPTRFEAFNEPDQYGAYVGNLSGLCGRAYPSCGALEAAELWELAQGAADRLDGGQVAALTVSEPESRYAVDYIRQLVGGAACGAPLARRAECAFPRYWAVHDYDDPTAGGTADLRAFEGALSKLAPRSADGPLEVWVTEAGVNLGSPTRADANRRGCPRTERDNAGTLGACVDGDPAAQARGARVWRSLLSVRAPGVRTTAAYWFEFQLIPSWDSALVDSAGRARASLCALVNGIRCSGDPRDYLLDRRR